MKIAISAVAIATMDGLFEQNYERAFFLGGLCLAYKPDIILFPETFAGAFDGPDITRYAEDPESKNVQWFRALSARGDCITAIGYMEKTPRGIKNACVIFDRGKLIGVHYKKQLWPDTLRPYRDEPALMLQGESVGIFDTRFGRMGVLICYENEIPENWTALRGKVDFILSPYNCENDPVGRSKQMAANTGVPSAWADRTGTVFQGDHYMPNMGSAGLMDKDGAVIKKSAPGVEDIVIGKIYID
ncbi:MAG: carbon-nitrogen hydrolase family protein [Treponema sp.]|jgi:predicted amidohydrolase|nr:carbon-nitrogen hydrolase family protein [Treponema sp.]